MKTAIVIGALMLGTVDVSAECIRELPAHRTGHWKYRFEDGHKCWFGPGGRDVATDLPGLRHDHRVRHQIPVDDYAGPTPHGRPKPIPSLADGIEEETPDPAAYLARRVKTYNV